MIDHISVAVRDVVASRAFYEAVLAPLDYSVLVDRGISVAFGKSYPEVWLNQRSGLARVAVDTGIHVCLRAKSEAAVDAFFDAAIKAGGASGGDPGPRQAAMTSYYAAFITDLDGNRLEAASFPAA